MAKLQRNQYRKGNKENPGGFQASFAREGKRARAERDTHTRARAWMDQADDDTVLYSRTESSFDLAMEKEDHELWDNLAIERMGAEE